MALKKIELEDRELLDRYLLTKEDRSCDMVFPNIFLWSRKYKVGYEIVEDCLVFGEEGRQNVNRSFPFGTEENKRRAVLHFMKQAKENGGEWFFNLTTESDFALLEKWFPGCFTIQYNRDRADYVYETEKLATLSGKKYHKKKNHVNKFKSLYPDWSYERITDDNVEECFQMALKWRTLNGCDDDEEKNDEMCVTMNALRLIKELRLSGGLLRVNGEVVAFAIGEPLRKDMFCVHIEKALTEIQGAYPMINQQFVLHECMDYKYVNREEDTGLEGLRKAKESYRPVFLVNKGYAHLDISRCEAYI
ncbi:MAG: DUF2156 domain-containing protein [Eubacterium sp.]|nr:DUF2156 domain-containing protein [Eubacterium sp.]